MTLLSRRFALALPLAAILAGLTPAANPAPNAEAKPKRLLLVTHSGGFVHDSVAFAEETLKEIGPKHGFDVTCYRFTGDPKREVGGKPWLEKYNEDFRKRTGVTVGPENIGRINKDTLKNFDVVLFFTTGSQRNKQSPLTDEELADLLAWVEAGGAFAGTHCRPTPCTTRRMAISSAGTSTGTRGTRRSNSRSKTRPTRPPPGSSPGARSPTKSTSSTRPARTAERNSTSS